MEIVRLQKSHIKNALELIWLVFQEFESPDYSQKGIDTFKDFISYDSVIEKVDKEELLFWGCFIDCTLAGVITLRDTNHISMLFVRKEYQRQGIAKKLFQIIKDYCKSHNGADSITVNSSPYAVEVYHRLGFKDINTEQTVNGIRFTPMKYLIKKDMALLVVDVQNALVLAKPFILDEVIGNIKKLIRICRENGIEVIYIQHNDKKGDELEPYTDGWKIYGEINPKPDETVIHKNYNSAFKETNLKEYLDIKGITQLIITGMQTDYCVDATIKVAFEYGYKLIIPEETNTTFDNGNISARDLYEHYNFNVFKGRYGIVESIENAIERIIS